MMRTLSRAWALLLALTLLLCAACGKQEPPAPVTDPAPGASSPGASVPSAQQPSQPSAPAEPAPAQPVSLEEIRPGMLPRPEPGAYFSGTTVAFENEAYAAFSDGIYKIAKGECLLLASGEIPHDTVICTDGTLLYYVDTFGILRELDLQTGDVTPITSSDTVELPFRTAVIGATQGYIWVNTPFNDDFFDAEDSSCVYAIGRISGEVAQTFPFVTGGCAGGYVWIRDFAFDFGPGGLKVFSPEDELIVEREDVWNVSGEAGAIWYDVFDEINDQGVLYRLDGEGETVAFTLSMKMDESYYGMALNGFLIQLTAVTGSADFLTYYYDARTWQPVPAKSTWVGLYEPYWDEGRTLNGQDYLLCYDRAARITDDGPVDVMEMPTDVQGGRLLLWEDFAIVDCWEGEYYVLPFDPAADVIVTPMTCHSEDQSLYDGKNGATVVGTCTAFGAGNNIYWPGLNEALSAYNEDAAMRLHVNLEALVNDASQQIENGFATADDLFLSNVNAYIRRSDTRAFCFTQHQTTDNRVNRYALDIRTGYNFDTRDGHALSLDEVVTDLSALRELLADRLQDERYPTREAVSLFLEDLFQRDDYHSTPEFSWVLGYEGLTFYFNGQINYPYDMLSVSCAIPFDAAPGLFEEKWLSVPRNYAYDVLLDDVFQEEYVLSSDGGHQQVLLTLGRDHETGLLTSIDLYQGADILGEKSQTVSRPLDCDTAYGTILHQDGKNYLAVQCVGDDLWMQFYSLDETFSRISHMEEAALPQNLSAYDYDSDLPYYANCWLGDPGFFAVNGKEWIEDELVYTHRVYYRFTPTGLTRLDKSGASFAYG